MYVCTYICMYVTLCLFHFEVSFVSNEANSLPYQNDCYPVRSIFALAKRHLLSIYPLASFGSEGSALTLPRFSFIMTKDHFYVIQWPLLASAPKSSYSAVSLTLNVRTALRGVILYV